MPSAESPQHATIRHAGWLAAVKPVVSGPASPEFSTEPTTATAGSAPWLDADGSVTGQRSDSLMLDVSMTDLCEARRIR
jgi:hypothetical protein